MKTEMKASPSFAGKLKVQTFTEDGAIESVKELVTTKVQDALVKRVSNSMATNGARQGLDKSQAEEFFALIELLTGTPLKKTEQPKMMINGHDQSVIYGDVAPEKGGFFVKLDLQA